MQQVKPRLLMTGSSGFVGRALSVYLQRLGYDVVLLKRGSGLPTEHEIFWDIANNRIDLDSLEDLEAVVHLAGEGIASHSWTPSYKERLHSSRIDYTQKLVSLLLRLQSPPRLFLSASAVGYYGDRGDEILTENSPKGSGFLANLCQEWEQALSPLTSRNIRTLSSRFGIILHPSGGMLKQLLPLYRLCLGATLGSGNQFISWISLDDLLRAIAFCLTSTALQGPVNFVAPAPLRQREFSHLLADHLHRPAFWTLPPPLLRFLLGERADALLLSSQRVLPEKLQKSGFLFQDPDLPSALQRMKI